MALLDFGLNAILNLVLIVIEFIILMGFLYIFYQRRNIALKPLIWSIFLYLLSNISSLVFFILFDYTWSIIFVLLANGFMVGGIIFLLFYLEMFESEEPFSKRSTISIILVMLTIVFEIIGLLPGEIALLGAFGQITYIIPGIIYVNYINKIQKRARVKSQKRKVRTVKIGVYMLFIAPLIIGISLIGMIIIFILISGIDPSEIIVNAPTEEPVNIGTIDPLIMFSQLIGLILLSLPILFSQSTYFMQSRRLSRLIIITDAGMPIYDFKFAPINGKDNELLLSGALTAIRSVMHEATGASKELQAIVFGDLHIITEVREGFAANLLVEKSSALLKDSLRLFADDFQTIYEKTDSGVLEPDLREKAQKMIRKNFHLEKKEFEEILTYQKDEPQVTIS